MMAKGRATICHYCGVFLGVLGMWLSGCNAWSGTLIWPFPVTGQVVSLDAGMPVEGTIVAVSSEYWLTSSFLEDLVAQEAWDNAYVALDRLTASGSFASSFGVRGGGTSGTFLGRRFDFPPDPPVIEGVLVYVRSNDTWLELEVPLQPGDQVLGEDGRRHVTLPPIFVSATGLSLEQSD